MEKYVDNFDEFKINEMAKVKNPDYRFDKNLSWQTLDIGAQNVLGTKEVTFILDDLYDVETAEEEGKVTAISVPSNKGKTLGQLIRGEIVQNMDNNSDSYGDEVWLRKFKKITYLTVKMSFREFVIVRTSDLKKLRLEPQLKKGMAYIFMADDDTYGYIESSYKNRGYPDLQSAIEACIESAKQTGGNCAVSIKKEDLSDHNKYIDEKRQVIFRINGKALQKWEPLVKKTWHLIE